MKEAKKYTNMTPEEFRKIAEKMEDVPMKPGETQKAYYVRLRERHGVNRSRATLQIIEYALREAQGDIEKANEIYRKKMKENTEKATESKRKARQMETKEAAEAQKTAETQETAEEQVPGQIEMDLTTTKAEMSEQVKMMRFIAGQVDKLYMKLDKLNDTMSMILRAVRKE